MESAIINMAMSGKLPARITEGKLIEILERQSASASSSTKGSIQIHRKKYDLDSDDDDDDDDL